MSKSQVSPAIVKSMTEFYGSLTSARTAYRRVRDQVHAFNAVPSNVLREGRKVVWASTAGELFAMHSTQVHYDGSPDAPFVLPS